MNTGEVGVALNLWTEFDMSAGGATFALELTNPNGVVQAEKTPTLNTSIVVVPDDVIDEATGLRMVDFPANESVLYTTVAADSALPVTGRAGARSTGGAEPGAGPGMTGKTDPRAGRRTGGAIFRV